MSHRLLASITGVLLLGLPVPALAAGPADVTFRVEGSGSTLVPRTALRTDTRTINKDGVAGHDCTGTSAAGALEIGSGGNWNGSWFDGFGYSVERIGAESHAFPQPDFFELWINHHVSSTGICQTELQQGDDVLFFVARCEVGPAPDFACQNTPVLPLAITVPPSVRPGVAFNVTVVAYRENGTPEPAVGAVVSGGDAPATVGGDGVATLTLGTAGPRALQAGGANRARSAPEAICATTGADGACGATAIAGPGAAACATNGRDGRCSSRDRTAPEAGIRGIAEGRRFARRHGPRRLAVRVTPDPSGLLAVKLRLTRTDGRRCTYFSGKSERFRHARCGASHGKWFKLGDRQDVDYLLPSRLSRGRYVLDVNAIDKAYNRDDARRRGGNRIVFRVG